MAERASDPSRGWLQRVHPDCRDFVLTVEELLERRRSELARGADERMFHDGQLWPRSWHRTELEDTLYSSYKQMRQGRITRPPRRETVMAIADYLSCTVAERNRLLLAAHAAPLSPYLTGKLLDELLPLVIPVAQQLPMPAMVINRDWRVHYQNPLMLEAFGVSPGQLEAVRPEQRNVLRLLFDPALPLQPNLIGSPESWERMARQTIYGFKMANILCQHEAWYAELVASLMRLPGFEQHWRTVQVDASFAADPSARLRSPGVLVDVAPAQAPADAARVQLRPLVISVGYFQFDFPLVLAFARAGDLPAGAA